MGGNAALPEGEEPEGKQRSGDGQGREGEQRRRAGQLVRHPLAQHGHGKRGEGAGEELHRGHSGGIAALEKAWLGDDESRREECRGEHEQVPTRGRAATGGAGDQADAEQGEAVAAPGERPGAGVTETGGDERDDHRHGADDDGGMAHARMSDARVLEHDHPAEAERARGGDARRPRGAQSAPARDGKQGRGDGEARKGQPGRPQPSERELGQRHGQAPESARGSECGDGTCTAICHNSMIGNGLAKLAPSFDISRS